MKELIIKNDQIAREELFSFYLDREDIHELMSFDDYVKVIEKQEVKVVDKRSGVCN